MGPALTGLGLLLASGSAILAAIAGVWTAEPITGLAGGLLMVLIGLLDWLG
ncbi:MAG TPA: hypothetical protein PLX03_08285 [Candidatus Hydrogenedentes bacterium]|nr:hypothetical protein [Candidatus Hydrogenedentota bacterium]